MVGGMSPLAMTLATLGLICGVIGVAVRTRRV